jgi:hypothetical protein
MLAKRKMWQHFSFYLSIPKKLVTAVIKNTSLSGPFLGYKDNEVV